MPALCFELASSKTSIASSKMQIAGCSLCVLIVPTVPARGRHYLYLLHGCAALAFISLPLGGVILPTLTLLLQEAAADRAELARAVTELREEAEELKTQREELAETLLETQEQQQADAERLEQENR
jgi:hypothetical protein